MKLFIYLFFCGVARQAVYIHDCATSRNNWGNVCCLETVQPPLFFHLCFTSPMLQMGLLVPALLSCKNSEHSENGINHKKKF